MSWDVLLSNEDGDEGPLGSAAKVRQLISKALPDVDWSDPTWGIYDGGQFTIEFALRDDDPIQFLMLHVRGDGDPIATIGKLATPLGWSAFDCSTSEPLDFDDPSTAGWEDFRELRDQFVEQRAKPKKKPARKAAKAKPKAVKPSAAKKKSAPKTKKTKSKTAKKKAAELKPAKKKSKRKR